MTGSRQVGAPTSARTRLSLADKHAIVQQARRLGEDGRPLAGQVAAVARQHGVSPKSVYRWMKDPMFAGDTPPERKPRKGRFDLELEHLTVVANEQDRALAHEKMVKAGLIDCGYSTFTRAMRKRTDPTLVAAAMDGWKGLVNNRMYLSWTPPHRNHTFHLDHTKLDLWVWPSSKHRDPVRPFVTVVVDGYSSLIHAVPWLTDVDGDMVAAALADATVRRDYYGTVIGGLPEQVMLDNAAQHFGPAMHQAVLNLGWVLAPTAAYSSWQNGRAERAIGLINQRMANRAPAATNAGTTRTGASRFVPKQIKDLKREEVLSARAFKALLQEVVDEINTSIPMERHGGQTRLEAYAQDPTEQRFMDQSAVRIAMLSTDTVTHKATKNGIEFDTKHYVGVGLKYGRRYVVRYLPNNRDFIEAFDAETGEFAAQCREVHSLDADTRHVFMVDRAEQEKKARAIEAGMRAHRRHDAAARNAQVKYEDDEDASTSPQVDGAALPEGQAAASTSVDPDAMHTEGLLAEVTRFRKPGTKTRKRGSGTPLPRVPARPAPSAETRQNQDKVNNLLASRFADVLPTQFQETTNQEPTP